MAAFFQPSIEYRTYISCAIAGAPYASMQVPCISPGLVARPSAPIQRLSVTPTPPNLLERLPQELRDRIFFYATRPITLVDRVALFPQYDKKRCDECKTNFFDMIYDELGIGWGTMKVLLKLLQLNNRQIRWDLLQFIDEMKSNVETEMEKRRIWEEGDMDDGTTYRWLGTDDCLFPLFESELRLPFVYHFLEGLMEELECNDRAITDEIWIGIIVEAETTVYDQTAFEGPEPDQIISRVWAPKIDRMARDLEDLWGLENGWKVVKPKMKMARYYLARTWFKNTKYRGYGGYHSLLSWTKDICVPGKSSHGEADLEEEDS